MVLYMPMATSIHPNQCYNVPVSPSKPQIAQQLYSGSGNLAVYSQVGAIQSLS